MSSSRKPSVGFEPSTPGFEDKEHLRNAMRKENCQQRLYENVTT